MGYIGKVHKSTSVPARTLSMLTGDGAATILNLSQTPMSASNVSVYFDGVAQTPETDYTLSGSQITFSEAVPVGSWVCAMVNGGETISSPMNDSVTTETIVDGAITNAKILNVEASKLTGSAYPALNASAVTFGGSEIFDKNSSDPTITSNKTLGTVWVNTTTGNMFVLTDATTDQNNWINVGSGTGYVHDTSNFQGEIAGFITGGHGGGAYTNNIDRFSFIQDGNATDHGDLAKIRYQASGSSSSTHGYTCGGYGPNPGLSSSRNEIDRFAFNSSSGATDVGTLSATKRRCSGQSSSTHGYNSGGDAPPPVDLIEKYTFAASSTVSSVGTMTIAKASCAGQTSPTHGYNAGGTFVDGVPQPYNVIDKFPFASDTNATDVGNLTVSKVGGNGGCSSTTNGYYCGGYLPTPATTTRIIEKFSFASNNNASNIANLLTAQTSVTGTSAVNYGYVCGGGSSNNELQKFTFASDADATNVGDLVLGREYGAGQQF